MYAEGLWEYERQQSNLLALHTNVCFWFSVPAHHFFTLITASYMLHVYITLCRVVTIPLSVFTSITSEWISGCAEQRNWLIVFKRGKFLGLNTPAVTQPVQRETFTQANSGLTPQPQPQPPPPPSTLAHTPHYAALSHPRKEKRSTLTQLSSSTPPPSQIKIMKSFSCCVVFPGL